MSELNGLHGKIGFWLDPARNLWRRHRLRTVLSSLGVMCGVASLLSMLTIGEGARRETMAQISRLGLENVIVKGTANPTDDPSQWRESALLTTDRDALMGLHCFDQAVVVKELALRIGEAAGRHEAEVLATEPVFARMFGLTPSEGRFLHPQDLLQDRQVCVVGADIARMLQDSGAIGQTMLLGDEIYTIIGRLAPVQWSPARKVNVQSRNFNQCVFVPISGRLDPDVSEIVAHVRKGADVLTAGKLVERNLALSRGGMKPAQIIMPLALLHQAEESRRLFDIILGSIALISLVVGGIGIMNIMLAGVAERTPEIGLRRAVGATRRDILLQFVAEAIFIGIIGACVGIGMGLAASAAVSALGGWPTALTASALLLPVVMSIVVTALAGLYPAWLAAHVNPIVALRQTPW